MWHSLPLAHVHILPGVAATPLVCVLWSVVLEFSPRGCPSAELGRRAAGRSLPADIAWRLVVGDGVSWDIGDTFLNSAKEADFIRNGNAKQIMSLSKENTTALWNAVQDNDYASFNKVNSRLLNTSRELRNVPLRIYIPTSPSDVTGNTNNSAGAFKVMQSLVQPRINDRTPQTVGAALRTLLPKLFPSSRDPVLAAAILHGARIPFHAPLEELMREAAYPDGWLCLVVVPLDI
ncbi:hypothetical protein CIB48_g11451 [Xylaria polymorpha]|nr:hypothetical protein CIB48_g11451 [Xylaria polymorpha]